MFLLNRGLVAYKKNFDNGDNTNNRNNNNNDDNNNNNNNNNLCRVHGGGIEGMVGRCRGHCGEV